MNKVVVKIVNKSSNPLPQYATAGAAGMDICSDEDMLLEKGKISLVSTGLYIELPHGYEAQIRCRSGLALKHGIMLVNGIGTIDADYRGEIKNNNDYLCRYSVQKIKKVTESLRW
jgi:dUTP pyrophosphatase